MNARMRLLKELHGEVDDRMSIVREDLDNAKLRRASDKPRGNELARTRLYGRRDILREMKAVLREKEVEFWGVDAQPALPPMWTTRENGRVDVNTMTNSHVRNTHKLLATKLEKALKDHDYNSLGGIPSTESGLFWCYQGWLFIFENEMAERQIEHIAFSCFADYASLLNNSEPWWDGKIPISKIPDNDLSFLYQRMIESPRVVSSYLSGYPNGEMAQLAFDIEFREALEFNDKAINWIRIIRHEIDRRGLELVES